MPQRKVRVNTYAVSTRITRSLLDEIEEMVRAGLFIDVADYLRTLIRKDLDARRAKGERTT